MITRNDDTKNGWRNMTESNNYRWHV